MSHFVEIILNGNSIQCIDHGGYETRNDSIIKLSKLAFEKIKDKKIFNKKLLVFTEDNPVIVQNENILKEYEIYNQCDLPENFDKIFPDFVFDNWKQVGILDYDLVCNELHEVGKENPIIPKLFWIGSLTHLNRQLFIEKTKNNENVIAILNNWIRKHDTTKVSTLEGSKFVSLKDHSHYQYLIDLEGNGYSGRIKILSHMNRILIIQDRPFWDWGSLLLKENEHYIKVDRNFKNFDEVFNKIIENPEKFENMRKKCFEFSKKNLTQEKAIEKIVKIFLK